MEDLFQASPRVVIGSTLSELEMDFATELHSGIATTVSTGRSLRQDLYCRLHSGSEWYFDCQFIPVFDEHNNVEAVVKVARDITERKQTEYQVWRNANFDVLTGLPNRRLFLDRLQQALLEAERNNSTCALLFIDLDRFKQANDQLGHKAGDRLLAQVAERLSTRVRATDTVARLGGDEYTLILKDTARDGALDTARELLTSLERAFTVDAYQVHISASIGLTLFPEDGKNTDQLLRNADLAMYAAKESGGQQIQVYAPSLTQSESEHMWLNRELGDALRKNQLEVYYQPIIDLRSGAIAGAEALLRWNHPDKGVLDPDAFFTIAEQAGLMENISAYVLEKAVTCSLRWRNQHNEAFPISINESSTAFVTRSLVNQWRARLAQVGLHESRITLELTSISLSNILGAGFNPVKSLVLAGRRLQLAINNFGIEPFSLLALRDFEMNSVKVDRELIKDAGRGGSSDRILEAIIAMAHAMKAQVVGVGVENDGQLQFLARAGCDYAQGFLFSRPLCQNDFEALLERNRQEPSF